jgi:hypothetical protein
MIGGIAFVAWKECAMGCLAMKSVSARPSTEAGWRPLYTMAGAAALITAIVIPIQVVVFLIWPPPLSESVSEWYALFEMNKLAGLIDLDLLLVVDMLLLIPILLALYVSLRHVDEPTMLVAVALAFLSVTLYIATNPAFEMLGLAGRFAIARGELERGILLAAGEALLAAWEGTAFHVAYLAGSVAGIAYGIVMARSEPFGKMAGIMGVVGNAVGLGLYIPVVGLYISVFSVLFLEIWYLLIGMKFVVMGRSE